MAAGVAAVVSLAVIPAVLRGQAPAAPAARPAAPAAARIPRTADGKPDLNGVWQSMTSANWDIQDHAPAAGPVVNLGAAFFKPGGASIVDGNEIPYRPEALAKKKENGAKWLTEDPEVKCYMPGVPRATYMPYPFRIVQPPNPADMIIGYEFASAVRIVHMSGNDKSPAETWMGWNRGKWEGDTLVIDATSFNDQTWFDRAGNYHSDALHVVERYTPRSADTMNYEATIEDPKVFSRPWKMSMPIYRHVEKNAQLMEFKCVEFTEEMLYGHLRKKN